MTTPIQYEGKCNDLDWFNSARQHVVIQTTLNPNIPPPFEDKFSFTEMIGLIGIHTYEQTQGRK